MDNPRESAFLAVWKYLDTGAFVADTLNKSLLDQRDRALAQEIALGTLRRLLSCEYIATQATDHKKLKVKKKEKALLLSAVYQLAFMQKVPSFAICDEMVKLAKIYCHRTFPKFLNALLRNLSQSLPSLPEGDDVSSLSVNYSYPLYLVEKLLEDYDLETTKSVLELGNERPIVQARLRSEIPPEGTEKLSDTPPMATIVDTSLIPQLATQSDLYIQNATPVNLIYQLAENIQEPKNILDLCASPGGKLLLAHDLFPKASLYANDVSEDKLKRLQENLDKYQLNATLTCGPGEAYEKNTPFDLIIIDAPCSNSGTMNKRVEARWRVSKESLEEQTALQLKLLSHAQQLLSPKGQIWYMTCSILKEENENLVDIACEKLRLKEVSPPITFLPNSSGWDGGFAQALSC